MKINGRLVLFTLLLVVLATTCKFLFGPDLDWSGFSPVIAIAVFAGMIVRRKNMSFLLPLIALLVSDLAIHLLYLANEFPYAGFYSGQWVNYLILLSATLIGWIVKGRKVGSVLAGAVAAPTIFFLISNFTVWMGTDGSVYPKSFPGLMTCYTAGIPFYKNALLATVIFLPAILVAYNYVMQRKTAVTLA